MPKIKAQSRLTQELLAVTDSIVWSAEIETCAVGIKEGRATLYLGKLWRKARDPMAKEMMLRHEAFHLFLGHQTRQGNRETRLWNTVCDAAIHADPTVDYRVIEAVQPDLELITYERLKDRYPTVCMAPPEVVYQLIKNAQDEWAGPDGHRLPPGNPGAEKGGPEGFPGGCGRDKAQDIDDDLPESKAKRTVVEAEISQGYLDDCSEQNVTPSVIVTGHNEMGGKGFGSRPPAVIKPRPDWVDEVLDRVLKRRANDQRRRSWRRQHRYLDSGLLPGRVPGDGWNGLWIIDASGSIDHSAIDEMLSAVIQEPKLRYSKIAVFDTTLELPLSSINEIDQVQKQIRNCGGGTSIKKTDETLNSMGFEGTPRVWLSDAHSSDGLPPERDIDHWVLFDWRRTPRVVDFPGGEK